MIDLREDKLLLGCTIGIAHPPCCSSRRRDTLPLRRETATGLRAFFTDKLPTARAFRMPHKDRVSDMIQADLAETKAVAKRPDLSWTTRQAKKATGTDGKAVAVASCLSRQLGRTPISVDDLGQNGLQAARGEVQEEGRSESKNAVFDSETAENRRGRDSNPGWGFNPHDGLANRCLKPLGHLSKPSAANLSEIGGLCNKINRILLFFRAERAHDQR